MLPSESERLMTVEAVYLFFPVALVALAAAATFSFNYLEKWADAKGEGQQQGAAQLDKCTEQTIVTAGTADLESMAPAHQERIIATSNSFKEYLKNMDFAAPKYGADLSTASSYSEIDAIMNEVRLSLDNSVIKLGGSKHGDEQLSVVAIQEFNPHLSERITQTRVGKRAVGKSRPVFRYKRRKLQSMKGS